MYTYMYIVTVTQSEIFHRNIWRRKKKTRNICIRYKKQEYWKFLLFAKRVKK